MGQADRRMVIELPPEVHRAAHVYAAEHDITLRKTIETAIVALVSGNATPRQKAKEILNIKRGMR